MFLHEAVNNKSLIRNDDKAVHTNPRRHGETETFASVYMNIHVFTPHEKRHVNTATTKIEPKRG